MRLRLGHIYRLRYEDGKQRRDRLDIDHRWAGLRTHAREEMVLRYDVEVYTGEQIEEGVDEGAGGSAGV